jgi:uncharacterized lipoprotein YddW (UPF0748 family)
MSQMSVSTRAALNAAALLIIGPLAAHAQPAPDSALGKPAPSVPAQEMPPPTSPDSGPLGTDQNGELRGMWVVRESLASPQSVHQIVVTASKYHINALFVQVRGRGDAWYNSPYEPRAEELAGQPKEFDPLEQIVREGHAAGLQVHAWMNTFLTWSGTRAPKSPQHLWNAHRDWFARDRSGHCSPIGTDSCEGAFLQPSNPAVQQHLLNVFTDVATRYDVDGIHFDYCRYPGTSYDFSTGTLRRFRDYMSSRLTPQETLMMDGRLKSNRMAYVHAFASQWADWRRAQVTNVVAKISEAAKAAKPYIEVSAAVFPDANEAFAVRGQDWRGWLKAGYLDAVALMAYDKNTDRVVKQTRAAIAAAGDKHVYTGVGAWRLGANDVAHKIAEIRKTGAAGVNLFSYGGVHSRANYLDTLARGVFASRSAPRKMRWLPERTAGSRTPQKVTRKSSDEKVGSGQTQDQGQNN